MNSFERTLMRRVTLESRVGLRAFVPSWFCICLLFALTATGCVHEVRQRPFEKPKLPQPKERFLEAPGGRFWRVVFADPGLTFLSTDTREGGEVRFFRGGNEQLGISMIVYIEPAEEPKADNARVRDLFWRQARGQATDTKLWETEKAAFVAYTVPDFMGSGMPQRTIALFISHEGAWVGVQVSKIGYPSEDEKTLERIANSVRIEETGRLK